jgi:hypothetical protein
MRHEAVAKTGQGALKGWNILARAGVGNAEVPDVQDCDPPDR